MAKPHFPHGQGDGPTPRGDERYGPWGIAGDHPQPVQHVSAIFGFGRYNYSGHVTVLGYPLRPRGHRCAGRELSVRALTPPNFAAQFPRGRNPPKGAGGLLTLCFPEASGAAALPMATLVVFGVCYVLLVLRAEPLFP